MNRIDIKKEFRSMRVPKMDYQFDDVKNIEDFIFKLRKQDKDDERYILKRKLLPISIGLFLFTIVVMIKPIQNTVLFTGCLFVFVGIIIAVILYLLELKNISKETFDSNLMDFLEQKEARLKSWRVTPVSHFFLQGFYFVGLTLIILGNTVLIRDLKSTQNVIIYIGINLIIFFLAGLLGEHMYRKRHKKKHVPLLKAISKMKEELTADI